MSEISRLVSDITAAPLGRIIASVGEGVAEAQRALDSQALEQLLALYSQNDAGTRLLRESGWRPTFYTLPETEGEVKVALSLSQSEPDGGGGEAEGRGSLPGLGGGSLPLSGAAVRAGTRITPSLSRALSAKPTKLYATPVDGSYRNRFGFEGSVSATIRFRIVPVPPPPEADRMRVVPDLEGMEVAEAARLLEDFDLRLEVDEGGDARIVGQSPEPGTVVRVGDVVRIEVEG